LELVQETTYVDETTICFKLRLDELNFTSKKEGISIFVNRELLPDLEKNGTLIINLNSRDRNLDQGFQMEGSIITGQFGESSVFAVKISQIYIASSYSNGAAKCSADVTREACQDNCRIAKIQKYCNCTPVSWSSLDGTTSEFCTLDDYVNCFQFSSANGQNYQNFQNESSNCSSNCLPYCTITKYAQQLTQSPMGSDHAKIIIKILQFPYFVYSENFVYTFNSFISEFGGDISLWVSLDFLLFLHFFYFVLCILLRLIMVLIKKAVIQNHEETPVEPFGENPKTNCANTRDETPPRFLRYR
jgi:hypothetical protein